MSGILLLVATGSPLGRTSVLVSAFSQVWQRMPFQGVAGSQSKLIPSRLSDVKNEPRLASVMLCA